MTAACLRTFFYLLMKRNILSFLLMMLPVAVFSEPVSKVSLNSDSKIVSWKLAPVDEVKSEELLLEAYDVSSWVDAVVPGAVFTSYVEASLEPDPNFGANAYEVDKAKYARDMWYRTEIRTEDVPEGDCQWLNFEGVNRRADVYFNGVFLGQLDGFMDRGKFDVSGLLKKDGSPNVLAVLVHIPVKPIANLASPTYISSDGWDWMPPVPGLLGGITDDVYFTASGRVTLEDVWLRTKVPSQDEGIITVSADIRNHGASPEKMLIKGVINPGNICFEKEIPARAARRFGLNSATMVFSEREFPQLKIMNPALWWPNGYGEPNLYECTLTCEIDGVVSDEKKVTFGIKEYSYDFEDDVFQLSVNGERIYCKGGNWGMSEYLLRCRGEEYDLKIRLHKEMNYNMIRNWIGSTTDDEFYQACDKYGIMVFDDFWLNSHPNLPTDIFAFNRNAVEKIKRLRNHPCIAVWCGDNEGVPVAPLNEWLREDVKVFDGGDRWYQPISREYGFSGSGPWTNAHPIWYFTHYPAGFGEHKQDGWGFRTEIGTAVFTNYESLCKFIPDADKWPVDNDMLEKHFFGRSSFNSRPDRYFHSVEYNYGKAEGTEDFCRKAQLLNLEVNKAMYEGWQHQMWNDASGILTWMSQSAYPSLVWQTYDYYYDLNGAYWGVKKACEPLHVQWSYADNSIKAVNATLKPYENVRVEAEVYDMYGRRLDEYSKSASGNASANRATYIMTLDFPQDGNLARGRKAFASSDGVMDYLAPSSVVDGNTGSGWSAQRGDDQWICVDLGQVRTVNQAVLHWESMASENYVLMGSADAQEWKEIHVAENGSEPIQKLSFDPMDLRYVKVISKKSPHRNMAMQEIELYGPDYTVEGLTPVHFIRLKMYGQDGSLLSENFYWRSTRLGDYTALNSLQPAQLTVKSGMKLENGKSVVTSTIRNKGRSVAFAVRVMPVVKSTGEQILPAIMDDSYFTLLPGESKTVTVVFDESHAGDYEITARPYND